MTRTEDKALLRADAFRRRKEGIAALDGEVVAAELLRHFESILPQVAEHATGVRVVAGFWPIGDEIDVRPTLVRLAASGWDCALPVTPPPGQPLGFRRWRHGDAMVRGRFGTSEPGPEAAILVPTLLIVPLLAFDRRGGRIGYGAGYYDRTLAALRKAQPTLTVGAAYALQEIERVPVDERDQPLDWVVTEKEAIDCRADRRHAAGSVAS
ncbi:MAG: 5-formyltetrahydrofolate cyclo-ligase [Acetobacterales bacterium]